MSSSRKTRRTPSRTCVVADCGRPRNAHGYCQTHGRQMRDTGRIRPIRPYRSRSAGTTKFAGLRLTPGCAQAIKRHAKTHNLSHGAAITTVLERWAKSRTRRS